MSTKKKKGKKLHVKKGVEEKRPRDLCSERGKRKKKKRCPIAFLQTLLPLSAGEKETLWLHGGGGGRTIPSSPAGKKGGKYPEGRMKGNQNCP